MQMGWIQQHVILKIFGNVTALKISTNFSVVDFGPARTLGSEKA